MEKKFIAAAFSVFSIIGFWGSASAATVTFGSVPSSSNPIVTSLTTDGFTFTKLNLAADSRPFYIVICPVLLRQKSGSAPSPTNMQYNLDWSLWEVSHKDGHQNFCEKYLKKLMITADETYSG